MRVLLAGGGSGGSATPVLAVAQALRRLGPNIEFLVDEMPHVLAAATIVVSRAGMGTLTELAALARPTLVVPLPDSHQRANAEAFARLGAVEIAEQAALTPEILAERVRGLLADPERRERLGRSLATSMPRDAAQRIAGLIVERANAERGTANAKR